MVCDTEYPNLRAASCCKVEVVNGGAGDLLTGLRVISAIEKVAVWHASKKAYTSSLFFKRRFNSAFRIVVPSGKIKSAESPADFSKFQFQETSCSATTSSTFSSLNNWQKELGGGASVKKALTFRALPIETAADAANFV